MKDRDLARAVRVALFASSVGLLANIAGAADYRIEPRVELGGIYNDNYRLSSADENAISGAMADAQVRWRAVTPTSEFAITPRIVATYFPDDRNEDDTDEYVTMGFTHNGQTWRAAVDGYYSHEYL